MRFVITGCGRSGTKYASKLLTACGLKTGHEAAFNAWPDLGLQPDWNRDDLDGDSSYVAAPFTGQLSDELTIVHQIRPPLDVIRSICGIKWLLNTSLPWVAFIDHHAHITRQPPGPRRAAAYWLAWNELAARHAHLTWTLPKISQDDVSELAARVGAELDPDKIAKALSKTSKRTNNSTRSEHVLDDLGPLRQQVVDRAEQYAVALEA